MPQPFASSGGEEVAGVWGRSGPEGSKRGKKLEAEAGGGVRRPVLQEGVDRGDNEGV